MCPGCWAVVLASFAVFFVISVLIIAGRDPTVRMVGVILGVTAICQKFSIGEFDYRVFLPWWWYVGVMSMLLARVAYLAFFYRKNLLVVQAWEKAKAYNARRRAAKAISRGSA